MTSHRSQESATIYRFPAGGRAGLAKRNETATSISRAPAPAVSVACGGSWYHEEAIRDAELIRN